MLRDMSMLLNPLTSAVGKAPRAGWPALGLLWAAGAVAQGLPAAVPAGAAAPAASAAAPEPAPSASGPARRSRSALEVCVRRPPPYPQVALREGRQGRSLVAFTIDASGELVNTAVAGSSGHAVLDEAALQHLERCRRSTAGLPDPVPPPGRYALPITWRIE